MWTNLIGALLALSAVEAPSFSPPAPAAWTRTRAVNPGSAALLARAAEKSSIVRSLLWRLEETDVVVYIADLLPGVMKGPSSYMAFVSRDLSARYLIIRVGQVYLSPSERIVLLGHELQHALEVAAAPDVQDAQTMAVLYRRIGWEGQKDKFETKAAQIVGHRIRNQLSGQRL